MIAALDELKLVARVAEALNLTQPAVSKQIKDLEGIVGTPIITRDRNRLYLTPVALRLAEHARQVLTQIDRAAFDIEAMAAGITGSVSIGAVSTVAPILLPGAIALLKRSAPETNVSVIDGHFVSLFPQLESGVIDLLITRIWQPQEFQGVEQSMLFSEPMVVVAGRDHALTRKSSIEWNDTAACPWILPHTNSVARRAVDTLFAENGLVTPSNTISSLSLTLNLEILNRMPALAFFPKSLAQSYSARGDLAALPLDMSAFLSEVRCFWRSENAASNSALTLLLKCLHHTADALKTIPPG